MISIITPVWNGSKFIESCIDNVIGQHCHDIEHVIIDGLSDDNTVDIIKRYAEKYCHIRLLSEKDRGQADAMNKGIALAKGEIIGFLNVDDYYEPGVLSRISDIFKALPEPSIAVANCNVWGNEGNLLYTVKPARLKLEQLLVGPRINIYPVNPSEYFYHKSLHDKIGCFNVEDHYAMDLDFLLRAIQAAHVRYFDEIWGNFRLIQGTKTFSDRSVPSNTNRYIEVIRLYKKDLPCYLKRFFWFYKSAQAIQFIFRYLNRYLKGTARSTR